METNNKTADNDAEIAKLTADNMHKESLLRKAGETVVGLMNKMPAKSEEIKKLRTLVKELADALDYSMQEHAWIVGCEESGRVCSGCSSEKCVNNKRRALLAMARKAIGGAK